MSSLTANGIELVDVTHRLPGQLTSEADAAFCTLIQDALRRYGSDGADAEAAADTLFAAAKGLMRSGDAHAPTALF